jgi:hypothetical protein
MGPMATFFLVLGVLALVAVSLLIVSLVTVSYRASARVQSELARIEQAGEPTSGAELDEHYRLPPGVEDTTDLWLQATSTLEEDTSGALAAELPIVGDSQAEIPPAGEPWPEMDAVEQLLDDCGRSLDLMHEAADLGGAARYPVDCSRGFFAELGHLQRLRGGARLLALEAHVRAHRGDPHGAAESIHAMFMLARSLEREPFLVSMLVRIACEAIAQEQLEELLWSVEFPDEDLHQLQADLRSLDCHEHLREAMVGERAAAMAAIDDPASLDVGVEKGVMGAAWRFTQREGTAFYLEHMSAMIAAAEKPWPQALQEADLAEARLEQLARGSILVRMRHMIPQLLAPALSAAFEAAARHAALSQAADASIAIEQYRRKHGKLPEQLDQLVPEFLPEVPTDPYNGQPLKYLVRDDEYLVYSVGSNRMDEGGLITEGLDGDYVFRVGPPREPEDLETDEDPGEEPQQDPAEALEEDPHQAPE